MIMFEGSGIGVPPDEEPPEDELVDAVPLELVDVLVVVPP